MLFVLCFVVECFFFFFIWIILYYSILIF
jgi:hypothetical protein